MGTPSPGWDSLVRQAAASARRRKRRRRARLGLWTLTVVTTAMLVAVGLFVKDISRLPTVAAPVALSSPAPSSPARPSAGASPSAAAHKVSPRPRTASGPRVTDVSSGLSYQLLASPWRAGCPAVLNTSAFSWTAGENAVAGQVTINGSGFDWHGNACSGQLQQQVPYSGPADLQPVATSLVATLDPLYYDPLVHSRTVQASSALQVSGHQAWAIRFLVSYSDAAAEGLNWTSELGELVLVDRGAGQAPAVFYVSVPANLGTSNVSELVESLQLG